MSRKLLVTIALVGCTRTKPQSVATSSDRSEVQGGLRGASSPPGLELKTSSTSGASSSAPDAPLMRLSRPHEDAGTPHADGGARVGDSSTGSTNAFGTFIGEGFPEAGPWVSFYGSAHEMGDLAKIASRFRIINIDADPRSGNFTDRQIDILRAGGRNRVISYMNIGSCENYRSYWSAAPNGILPCAANHAAQRGSYDGYPDETWMDPGNAEYRRLILEHVAPALAARVDGFYLDNLEILEHTFCSATCRQGGLDLVRLLREKYPRHLIVMQNATSDVTRLGTTGGRAFASLLDGIAHEEVYAPKHDVAAEEQLVAWHSMHLLSKTGRPFWIGVEDYAGSCRGKTIALPAIARARARGFSPYVSDKSGGQRVVCIWD